MEMVGYGSEIVSAGDYEGAEEFDPFGEYTEENIEIIPDSPPETQWYHGRLDRALAEKRLKEVGLAGSYLVRESDGKPGVYVLSFLNDNRIDHFKITAMCGAYYIGGREFNSLSLLIGYYTAWSDLLKGKKLIRPVPPPEPVFDRKLVKSIVRYMKNPDTDELSFVEGEVFVVLNDMGDGWFWVKSTFTNKSGIINKELVQELKDDDDPVNQYSWFHANMPRDEIASKLASAGPGSWLVRKSETTPGDFTMYFLCNSQVQKFKIQKRSAGLYFMGGRNYNSVLEVVERYKKENLVEGFFLEKAVDRDPPRTAPTLTDNLKISDSVNTVKHSNGSNFFLNRNDNIVLKGNLTKKSQKTKKWKNMFFVLNETEQQLFYFDNERKSKPKGIINLNNTSLYPVHDSLFDSSNVFLLVSKELNQTSINYLCAPTTDAFQEWTQKLRVHCTLSQQGHHHHHHHVVVAAADALHKKALPSQSLTEVRSAKIKIFQLKLEPPKHRLYCIGSLNDAKVCRTQTSENNCWDEEFSIDDIPPDVSQVSITIYSKEKMSKDKELSKLTLDLNDLPAEIEEGRSFPIPPFSKNDRCELKVSLRYRLETIMPVENYKLLSQLLLDDRMELVVLLEELCSGCEQDKDLLVSNLLDLFRSERQEMSLIWKFVERDIDQESNQAVLFRANTFGSSLMNKYMRIVASSYLQKATQATINSILKLPHETENNRRLTEDLFESLLRDIQQSISDIPPILKHIFYCIRVKVCQKWNNPQAETRAVSAFLFLRLLCPALCMPRPFNLITEPLSRFSVDMLHRLAACLNKLANLIDFTKEEMKCYNEFLEKRRSTIIDIIEQVSNEPVKPPSFGPSSVDTSRFLATIHRLCMSKSDVLKCNESQHQQAITRELLYVTDSLNTKEENMRQTHCKSNV